LSGLCHVQYNNARNSIVEFYLFSILYPGLLVTLCEHLFAVVVTHYTLA